ncbi:MULTISPECIES: hypothetical protein [Burkholderia]|uniref:hypothetical protein n=1 Tax=Burkholderia TaxID=32008 RepID=UPI000F684074|nr:MULTISPECIES: hypothetical protein [Burkholderia]MBG0876056.1 hypothetical protein [Burkholderia sp. 9775_39]MBG0884832.1 hypothetical protein [Burkholderia sp. 9773_38]MBR8095073.1 hypothetical protein [Burkholderia cenocepacia]MCW3504203.1 hypothetical protein [Burkholderia cenocepacia]MCW3511414.1 hypothetical protein [Burkholderia cenocepacia]
MKTTIRHFCTLLAAANFDRRQVHEIIDEISKASPRQILQEYEIALRRLQSSEVERETDLLEQPDDSMTNRVTDLLHEMDLTKTEAYNLLPRYLKASFPGRTVPPVNTKAGFANWIRNLLKEFSASEILHVVTRLRNERVHGSAEKDDWLHRGNR